MKVNFRDEIYSTLAEGEKVSHGENCSYQFPEWDILKEIERRARRADREFSLRDWMKANPEKVEEIRKRRMKNV